MNRVVADPLQTANFSLPFARHHPTNAEFLVLFVVAKELATECFFELLISCKQANLMEIRLRPATLEVVNIITLEALCGKQ